MKPDILKGIRVVDLTTYAAAPAAMRLMADWGADVIHVEGMNGDPMRNYGATLGTPIEKDENPIWQLENGSKRSVVLNLRTDEGKEAIFKLIESADVFATNTRIEVLKKMGLDYESVHARCPNVVWAHVSGYGIHGEENVRPGYDVVSFWSRGGSLVDLAAKGGYPMTTPIGFGDTTTSLAFLNGILAAVIKRRLTGEGSMVTASLLSTAVWCGGLMITAAQDRFGEVYPKDYYDPSTPLTHVYKCADGEWITLCIVEYNKFFGLVCDILGLGSEIKENPNYATVKAVKDGHVAELTKIVEEAIAKIPRAELAAKLAAADMAYECCQHYSDVTKDKQCWENHYLYDYQFPNGNSCVLPASPVQFSPENEEIEQRPAPQLGEHTSELLTEVGYTEEQIKALFEAKAIGGQ